jgi:putative FmdB family regulatory protein
MPIYEYVCQECESRYERLTLSGNGKPECPKCGSKRSTLQFSVFAAHTDNGTSTHSTAPASGSGCGCTPRTCGCK